MHMLISSHKVTISANVLNACTVFTQNNISSRNPLPWRNSILEHTTHGRCVVNILLKQNEQNIKTRTWKHNRNGHGDNAYANDHTQDHMFNIFSTKVMVWLPLTKFGGPFWCPRCPQGPPQASTGPQKCQEHFPDMVLSESHRKKIMMRLPLTQFGKPVWCPRSHF